MYSSKNSEDSVQCNTISNGKVSDGKYKKDELIDAVFRKVNLPEVHFIQSSPPISSPKTTSVPPNSVRSEIGEINIFEGENELIPRKSSTPQRQSPLSQCEDYNDEDIVKEEDDNFEIEKKQQKLNDEIKINLTNIMLVNEEKIKNEEIEIQQVEITLTESSPEINKKLNIKMTENKKEEEEEEEEEEELSIHLLAHKNSLDNGNIKCSTNTEINNKLKKEMEEEEEIEEIPLTPSTGEGCLDSVRSIIATNGETPTKIISEDDWSEQNNNIIDDNECRRVSSTISRELVNSVIELAIQNTEEFDDNGDNQLSNKKKKDDFQLELDKKILQKQQNYDGIGINNSNNYSSTNSISGQSSPSSGLRDIHVRTSLNDPSSPFKQLAYTAFEPEKQEIIRKEIGSFGPEGIKKIVDKFQNVEKLIKKEDEEIIAEIKNKKTKPKVFARQKSAHFYIEKEQVPKQQEDQPKRKNTPHPVQRQSSLHQPDEEEKINTTNNFALSRSEIVIESQRPVADILNQFQNCHYSHAANIKKALNEENDDFYLRKVRPRSFGSSDMQRNLGKNTSVWANNNKKNDSIQTPITLNTKEPTPGSLAAIRLSLNSSIPSTPSVSPIDNSPPNGTEKLIGNNRQQKELNNNNLLHGKDGILPKNVGHFYRIWGSAQAQSATKTTEKQSKIIENINNMSLATNGQQ